MSRAYCSSACASAARVARNKEQRPQLVLLHCAECGREFSRAAASQRFKAARTPDALDFCSRACATNSALVRALWSRRRSEFWRDPARRRNAAERRLAQMAAGVAPAVSRLEDLVAAALDVLGVSYTRQVVVRHPANGRAIACVDFMLLGGRVLEVFGTFWHCDPRRYPDGPVSPVQWRVRQGDVRKRRTFERLGVPHAVVWETDVLADASGAVARAVESLPGVGAEWLTYVDARAAALVPYTAAIPRAGGT
jgi:hypothetical protein